MKSILDLHTHTIVSGHAFSTIKENIEFAVKRQIKYLGISDHSSNMPASPHKYYFQNLKVIPREVDGVKILRGIEGNILDFEGNLDIDEDLYPGLDYVIASLHPPCVEFGSIEENTRAILNAMDIEKEMVNQTKKNYNEMGKKGFLKTINGDIRKIPFENKFFSVTHSSGVMEHFSDEDIVKIINEQLRVSDFCIFSVPTSYFEKKMLGNERFMNRKEWRAIIENSNGVIIKESGYHYKKFKNRLIDVIKKPKILLKPIALYTFIIKEK